jgi:hypothetical protein
MYSDQQYKHVIYVIYINVYCLIWSHMYTRLKRTFLIAVNMEPPEENHLGVGSLIQVDIQG